MKDTANKKKFPMLARKGIPDYSSITAENIKKEIPILIEELSKRFEDLEELVDSNMSQEDFSIISWDKIMKPLYKIEESIRWTWGAVCHMNGVLNTPELREAVSSQQKVIIRFGNKIGQSRILYEALSYLLKVKHEELSETQIRILEKELRAMKQKGVGLSGEIKKEFNLDSERLAELSTKFSNNVLDATKGWSLLLTEKEEIKGLPKRTLEAFAKEAINENEEIGRMSPDKINIEDGPWKVGLDMPSYLAFMTYGENRKTREKLYKAHVSRASNGKFDNTDLIEEILIIRKKQAQRLGYESWASLSLDNKMAKDIGAVEKLLEELRSAAFPIAKKELDNLKEFAKNKNASMKDSELFPWDIAFWSERQKEEIFNIDEEKLRPYFPLEKVLDGLFKLSERLFGIKIKPADGQVPIWHKDVKYFTLHDSDDSQIASFFLDPYSRPANKRGGAWMDECLGRNNYNKESTILPIAYLICNQTPPIDNKPSLMSFQEVETLFHEFGHGLQHMLTTVDYPEAAGINNVEWDAVELPSQFMENWCLDHSTLMSIAEHWETGEELPEQEFQKLKKSRTYHSGLGTLRQIHFALTDMKLHNEWTKENKLTPDELRREIAIRTTIIDPIKEDKFLCSFSHIFAGGYAAGYYSYKWAEVLSADAFSAFEEIGLENTRQIELTGKKFRETILSLGGSKSPEKIYKEFRGRPANTKALIRHAGLENK